VAQARTPLGPSTQTVQTGFADCCGLFEAQTPTDRLATDSGSAPGCLLSRSGSDSAYVSLQTLSAVSFGASRASEPMRCKD
jgi:hypothetical protein